ncbi:BEL1-like homeodomain protein 5 [Diospyros lotus]|uniref:BEL1-like homeodomain protein 5 n=1 Tax=Diospyros lotus TaxID=55363 RepID=UPI002257422C|nr:BEL1-like homeodomain protein 5 [Diospyros lotus]
MATYLQGRPEIQVDGFQTLYLINPNHIGYTADTQPPANMFFMDSAAGNAFSATTMAHAPPLHFSGIPFPTVGSATSEDPNRPPMHEIPTLHGIPRFLNNSWGTVDQAAAGVRGATSGLSGLDFDKSAVSPTSNQVLSLSLSSSQPLGYWSTTGEHDITELAPATSPTTGGYGRSSGDSISSVSNRISGSRNVIWGSKYLKAAQQLIDEVANMGKVIESHVEEMTKEKLKVIRDSTRPGSIIGVDLTTAERQELLEKKTKLVSILDEVEQRYKQYHHQLQIVVSLFEKAAGIGSAKPYTALALQTISKQFRCLKDMITVQIMQASQSLGEDRDSAGRKAECSRFKLGVNVPPNSWRHQRGLPERSVSILRAWLFEHFLHPYPKDSDKHMLAKQTGLTRNQVSNWFINARVRLWKPMVEDMYSEEIKNQEQKDSETNTSNGTEANKESVPKTSLHEDGTDQIERSRQVNQNNSPPNYEISNSTASTSPVGMKPMRNSDTQTSSTTILSVDMNMNNHNTLIQGTANHGGFGSSYPIGEIGRFDPELLATTYHGNAISLTLGLPHTRSDQNLSHQQNYFSSRNVQLGSRLDAGYENVNVADRKSFAAQLLQDFVA